MTEYEYADLKTKKSLLIAELIDELDFDFNDLDNLLYFLSSKYVFLPFWEHNIDFKLSIQKDISKKQFLSFLEWLRNNREELRNIIEKTEKELLSLYVKFEKYTHNRDI